MNEISTLITINYHKVSNEDQLGTRASFLLPSDNYMSYECN